MVNENTRIAKQYFEAFHDGRLEEVGDYFCSEGTVKFGSEPEKPAREFFPETADLIAQVTFETHGIYTSNETNDVIIHFSFSMPSEAGNVQTTEAIDIIEFDDDGKIRRVRVVTNG